LRDVRSATAEVSVFADGIVVTRIDAGIRQSLQNARENLELTIAACAGRRRPLLVDISRCLPLEPEVRHFFTGEALFESFLALALLVEATPFGRTMGNIYLYVAHAGIPTKLFEKEPAAITWLRSFSA
jgi:hypothetical protein